MSCSFMQLFKQVCIFVQTQIFFNRTDLYPFYFSCGNCKHSSLLHICKYLSFCQPVNGHHILVSIFQTVHNKHVIYTVICIPAVFIFFLLYFKGKSLITEESFCHSIKYAYVGNSIFRLVNSFFVYSQNC